MSGNDQDSLLHAKYGPDGEHNIKELSELDKEQPKLICIML